MSDLTQASTLIDPNDPLYQAIFQDLQGNILTTTNVFTANFWYCNLIRVNKVKSKNWLASLNITSEQDLLNEDQQLQASYQATGIFYGLSLSIKGYDALGLSNIIS